MQLALVGHDVGHNQLFTTRSANSIMGIFVTLFLGAGVQWWKYNHNTHHVTPNSSDHDPDIQVLSHPCSKAPFSISPTTLKYNLHYSNALLQW